MITVNFIHYISGSGGNFLGRVLSLDEGITGMGANGLTSSTLDRQKAYNYSTLLLKHENYKTEWVNYELENMHFPLTLGIEKLSQANAKIVQPVEPFNFYDKLCLLDKDDKIKHFHIEPDNCIEWGNKQKIYKGAHIVPDLAKVPLETSLQLSDLKKIIKKVNSYPIKLSNVISSEKGFTIEYEKACEFLETNSYTDIALEIYRSWKNTWARQ